METPPILWQTWKTKIQSDVPQQFQEYIKLWKSFHPQYRHTLLDDNDLREIVKTASPQHLDLYDTFTHTIEKVDFARYALLYLYGGVYADLDTKPLRPIDEWVRENKIIFGCEPEEHAQKIYGRDRVICNAIMFSPPQEKMWKDLMNYIAKHYEHRFRPVDNTGPLAITRFLESDEGKKYLSQILITDPCVFYPLLNDGTVSKKCDIQQSYVAHVWKNTWVKKWYQDPMWFNRRYWTCALLIIYVMMWMWCYKKT